MEEKEAEEEAIEETVAAYKEALGVAQVGVSDEIGANSPMEVVDANVGTEDNTKVAEGLDIEEPTDEELSAEEGGTSV